MDQKKLRNLYILFCLIALSVFSFQGCESTTTPEAPGESSLVIDKFTSTYLSEERDFLVYLPAGYDAKNDPYPLIFLLHGAGTDEKSWTEDVDVKTILDGLIKNKEMSASVVVYVDGNNPLGGGFYTDSYFSMIESYMMLELIPYIESHYNVSDSPAKRGIVGLSMGGYGTMRLACIYPDEFPIVACHSGPIAFDLFLSDNGQGDTMLDLVIKESAAFPDSFPGFVPYQDPIPVVKAGDPRSLVPLMFMMSGAFSDYVGTIDKFDIAKHQYAMAEYGGGLYVGLELPFLPDGSIKDNIWEQWLDNSPFVYDPGGIYNSQGLFETNLTNIKAAGQEIYFDCGLSDELSLNYHADAAHAILNSLSYDHEYQSFDGHHSDIIGERLAISLPWISDKFPK